MIYEYSLKKDGNENISPNFKVKEFACKDGNDRILIDSELINVLQQVRTHINQPIKIISGYRTEAYNKICNGAKNSYHLKGMAFDIRPYNCDLYELAILCAMYGAKGIGIYKKQNFIHIDNRTNYYLFRGD